MNYEIKQEAITTALEHPLVVPRDRAVFFSGKRSRDAAFVLCNKNKEDGYITLIHTDLHTALSEFNLFGKDSIFTKDEAVDINAIASARFARAASGNVMAYYNKVSSRSTFFTLELPLLIANPKVLSINGAEKSAFNDFVMPAKLPLSDLVPSEYIYNDGGYGNRQLYDPQILTPI